MDNKPKFWKSLNQYNDSPIASEKTKHEFANGVTDEFDLNSMTDKSRRRFLSLMGATSALVATACTNYKDKGEIISYNNKPEGVTFGEANYYASTLSNGLGVLVKTREGRPIKVDGNPSNLINKGKLDPSSHASIMDLYDPTRLRNPIKKSDSPLLLYREDMPTEDWAKVDKNVVDLMKNAVSKGKEIAILTDKVLSPTTSKLFAEFSAKYPTASFYSFNLFNDNNKINAYKESYGINGIPAPKIDEAKIILSLQDDFLGTDVNMAENTRKFTQNRNVDNLEKFNKLFVVEANTSLTGINSDYRIRLTPAKMYSFVLALINELGLKSSGAINVDSQFASKANMFPINKIASDAKISEDTLKVLVQELIKNKDKALVLAGSNLPKEVHLAVNYLNFILNNNAMLDFESAESLSWPTSQFNELSDLTQKMKNGKVDVVIHYGTNPVYHLPKDLGYEAAIKKVPNVISLVEAVNESCINNLYVLPINHDLESWNDFSIRNGSYSLQQPIIAPLHNTRQKEAILLNWMQDDTSKYSHDIYHKYLIENWKSTVYTWAGSTAEFMEFWYSCLHDGFIQIKQTSSVKPSFNISSIVNSVNPVSKDGFTIILTKSISVGDGSRANNGWLQELPNTVSKIVWDNPAYLAPATAKQLNVTYGEDALNQIADNIEININGRKLKVPVVIQPGMAENVIAIDLGYGRTVVGEIGKEVGYNANLLMSSTDGMTPWIYSGASVVKANDTSIVVSLQEHHSLDDTFTKDMHRSRHIIQEYTVNFYEDFEKKYAVESKKLEAQYAGNHEELEHKLHELHNNLLGHYNYNLRSITPPVQYPDVKWAMAIDMNKCTGCSACVTSCNVENNIPIVGKEECGKGREMHWMRIDTYYSGTPEDPIVSTQPMICQHCDNAPCENVCPVVATSHSTDGLNQMVYNRCVGTRYCANNCPYKVRRFNFFDFRSNLHDDYQKKDTFELLNNPEVTVRSRGVMEKCTFCVQRISEARQNATKEGRKIHGDDVQTACQVACPASAIVFGDMNDKNSEISKLREHHLGYKVLENINVKPNVTYLAKLRNIHTEVVKSEH